jgi:hypothetical protein
MLVSSGAPRRRTFDKEFSNSDWAICTHPGGLTRLGRHDGVGPKNLFGACLTRWKILGLNMSGNKITNKRDVFNILGYYLPIKSVYLIRC